MTLLLWLRRQMYAVGTAALRVVGVTTPKGYIHLEIWQKKGVDRAKKTPKEGGGYVYDATTILTPTYKTDGTAERLIATLQYQEAVMMNRRLRDDREFPDVYWMPLAQSTNNVLNGFTYVDNAAMPLNDTVVNGVVVEEGAMTWINNQVAQRFRPTTKISYNRGQSGIYYEIKIAWLAI